MRLTRHLTFGKSNVLFGKLSLSVWRGTTQKHNTKNEYRQRAEGTDCWEAARAMDMEAGALSALSLVHLPAARLYKLLASKGAVIGHPYRVKMYPRIHVSRMLIAVGFLIHARLGSILLVSAGRDIGNSYPSCVTRILTRHGRYTGDGDSSCRLHPAVTMAISQISSRWYHIVSSK
ncbi:hypothetical protein J6590_028341 [Homalodisca vitripennis]|nr:hypothetical protein J6590_028341 [Homalodisca vitripennis]